MLTLTTQEISDLTGRKQAAAQIRWLVNHGWKYVIGLDWLPKVALAYFEQKMVYSEPQIESDNTATTDEWQVNGSALQSISK